MNRRGLLNILVGVIATMSGMAAATFVQQRRCLDGGGQWDTAARACQVATGTTTGWSLAAIAAGLAVGVAVLAVLLRVVLFATGRAARRAP